MKRTNIITAIILAMSAAGCSWNIPVDIIDFTPEEKTEVTGAVNTVSESEIGQYLDMLNVNRSPFHPDNEVPAVEAGITALFESFGYTVELQPVICHAVHPYTKTEADWEMNNIIARKPGLKPDLPVIVVGAHWDSLPTPFTEITDYYGMNDNASGTSGVLELARVLAPLELDRTVIFICFAFEEEGLYGSEHFASTLSDLPALMINMDGIGDTSGEPAPFPGGDLLLGLKDHGRFIMVAVEEKSINRGIDFAHKSELFSPSLEFDVAVLSSSFDNNPMLGIFCRSDHTPFMLRGVPTVNFLVPSKSALELYHSVYDTIDVLDIPFMADVIRALTAFIYSQAREEVTV